MRRAGVIDMARDTRQGRAHAEPSMMAPDLASRSVVRVGHLAITPLATQISVRLKDAA
jgi:hypothetical protein